MDADRARFFLLSMLVVPAACGPGNPGASVVTDGSIPTDDDDNALGPPEDDDGIDGCEAFFGAFTNCRPGGSYGEVGPAEGGYYGDDGTVFPGFPEAAVICEEFDEIAERYGPGCPDALDDALACMAGYACLELQNVESACSFELGRAYRECPGIEQYDPDTPQPDPDSGFTASDTASGTSFDPTSGSEGGGGCDDPQVFTDSTVCVAQYVSCGDGNTYEVTCSPNADATAHTCVCSMNGAETTRFDIANPCTGEYESLAGSNCGYPV